MITFKLNGSEVQGEEGETILQVAERYGVEIPTLCYHKALEPAAVCEEDAFRYGMQLSYLGGYGGLHGNRGRS